MPVVGVEAGAIVVVAAKGEAGAVCATCADWMVLINSDWQHEVFRSR